VFVGQEAPQRLLGLRARVDRVADVRAVEAGDEALCAVQPQHGGDLFARTLARRGGQRDARHLRETLAQQRQLPVLGAEVVPPVRNAMRLVNGEQGEASRCQQFQRPLGQQPLRGDIEQVQRAAPKFPLDLERLSVIQTGVEKSRAHAVLPQRVHLVFHQRDQRRNHDAATFAHQGRELVAQRFAAAGRHQHQGVLSLKQRVYDLLLHGAEIAEAEDLAQGPQRRVGRRRAHVGARPRDANRRGAEAVVPGSGGGERTPIAAARRRPAPAAPPRPTVRPGGRSSLPAAALPFPGAAARA